MNGDVQLYATPLTLTQAPSPATERMVRSTGGDDWAKDSRGAKVSRASTRSRRVMHASKEALTERQPIGGQVGERRTAIGLHLSCRQQRRLRIEQ